MVSRVDIVFDGPPSKPGHFVEVEDLNGRSVKVGEWHRRINDWWVLRLAIVAPDLEERLQEAERRLCASATHVTDPTERARIEGQAEGVRLALSYLREGENP